MFKHTVVCPFIFGIIIFNESICTPRTSILSTVRSFRHSYWSFQHKIYPKYIHGWATYNRNGRNAKYEYDSLRVSIFILSSAFLPSFLIYDLKTGVSGVLDAGIIVFAWIKNWVTINMVRNSFSCWFSLFFYFIYKLPLWCLIVNQSWEFLGTSNLKNKQKILLAIAVRISVKTDFNYTYSNPIPYSCYGLLLRIFSKFNFHATTLLRESGIF